MGGGVKAKKGARMVRIKEDELPGCQGGPGNRVFFFTIETEKDRKSRSLC